MAYKKENIELGNRIKLAIKNSAFTQKVIAYKVGISEDSLSNYIKGKRTPDALIVTKIAQLCNISLDWLLTGEGEAPVKPSFKEQVKKEYQKEEKKKDTITEQALAIGLTEEEAEIIRKMRLVKGSKPILKQLLEGQIKIQEALNKFSNLATEDNKNPLLQTSKGQST